MDCLFKKVCTNMTRRLYDFKCPHNHITEHYIDSEEKETKCLDCDAVAKRIISPVTSVLDAVSGDFPGATMKWARDHSKAARKSNP